MVYDPLFHPLYTLRNHHGCTKPREYRHCSLHRTGPRTELSLKWPRTTPRAPKSIAHGYSYPSSPGLVKFHFSRYAKLSPRFGVPFSRQPTSLTILSITDLARLRTRKESPVLVLPARIRSSARLLSAIIRRNFRENR